MQAHLSPPHRLAFGFGGKSADNSDSSSDDEDVKREYVTSQYKKERKGKSKKKKDVSFAVGRKMKHHRGKDLDLAMSSVKFEDKMDIGSRNYGKQKKEEMKWEEDEDKDENTRSRRDKPNKHVVKNRKKNNESMNGKQKMSRKRSNSTRSPLVSNDRRSSVIATPPTSPSSSPLSPSPLSNSEPKKANLLQDIQQGKQLRGVEQLAKKVPKDESKKKKWEELQSH